jgi:hypothetical protein
MAAIRATSPEAIGKATARSFEEWTAFLDAEGAREKPHREIARMIAATGDASGWWAQTITVAYAQHIGRRQPGQMADGSYQASASRTLAGDPEEVFALLRARLDPKRDIDGVALDGSARTSQTGKRSYWRAKLADGTSVAVAVEAKSPGRSLVAVNHEKLADAEATGRWMAFWKEELGRI